MSNKAPYQIAGVRKESNGLITQYLIRKNGKLVWISKQKGVEMAMKNSIHAVLVHHKNGSMYLRPMPGEEAFISLIESKKLLALLDEQT